MSYTRDTTKDLVWDEESETYINAHNPTVKELEANGVVYDIVAKDLENADYVVEYQRPTAENNYTWYRLYKSGWVEQGGSVGTGETTLVFLKPMQDTNYFIGLTAGRESNWAGDYVPQFYSKTNTGVKVKFDSESIHNVWKVEGFAAQS